MNVSVATADAVNEASRETLLKAESEALLNCARVKAAEGIGMPSIVAVTSDLEGGTTEVRVCVAAPPDAKACEWLEAREQAARRVLARRCDAGKAGDCKEALQAELREEPWKLTAETMRTLAWRYAGTDAQTETEAAVRDAFEGRVLGLEADAVKREFPGVLVVAVLPVGKGQ